MGETPEPQANFSALRICRLDVDEITRTASNDIRRSNFPMFQAPTTDVYGRTVNLPNAYTYSGGVPMPIPFSEGPYSFQRVLERESQWRPRVVTCNNIYGVPTDMQYTSPGDLPRM